MDIRRGLTDFKILRYSLLEKRVILTFDRDFGGLIFKHRLESFGVIYFKWKQFNPLDLGQYLFEINKNSELELEGLFTVIDDNGIRQRRI